MQGTRPEQERTGGYSDASPCRGERRRALPRPTAQSTGSGGGRHARTGGSAANPQQNANESTPATVQKYECGLQVAHP